MPTKAPVAFVEVSSSMLGTFLSRFPESSLMPDSETDTADRSNITCPPKRNKAHPVPDILLILGSGTYLFLNMFNSRGVPFLLGGDQVFFWLYAQRLLAGELVYRDFLQRTPPGADLIYMAAFRLLGPRIWVPNLVVLALGIALCWVCFRVAESFLTRPQALLAASLFLVLLYGRMLNGTHHWFSELAVLGTVAVLQKGTSLNRIAIAGVLLGIATFFTQTRGPAVAVGMTGYLLWEWWRRKTSWRECLKRIAAGSACFLLTCVLLFGYFIAGAGPRQVWYWLVAYPARYMVYHSFDLLAPESRGHLGVVPYFFVYAALPVAYVFSLGRGCRELPVSAETERRTLLTFAGVATAIEVSGSPSWLRVFCVAAPGIVLLAWAMAQTKRFQRSIAGLTWCGVIAVALLQTMAHHRGDHTVIVRTSFGEAATTAPAAEKLEWIGQHTRPGDFFFQAGWPGIYLPLGLRIPVYVDSVGSFDETRPEWVAACVQQLEGKHVRYVLWEPLLNSPGDTAHLETYHLAPLRDYLRERYRMTYRFADQDEIWERR
jgi:hypothetical protein